MLLCSDTGVLYFDKETYFTLTGQRRSNSAVQVGYCASLNISRLQSNASDLTECAAFSIGSGSFKVLKYSNYSVQFRFALCDFEKYGLGLV